MKPQRKFVFGTESGDKLIKAGVKAVLEIQSGYFGTRFDTVGYVTEVEAVFEYLKQIMKSQAETLGTSLEAHCVTVLRNSLPPMQVAIVDRGEAVLTASVIASHGINNIYSMDVTQPSSVTSVAESVNTPAVSAPVERAKKTANADPRRVEQITPKSNIVNNNHKQSAERTPASDPAVVAPRPATTPTPTEPRVGKHPPVVPASEAPTKTVPAPAKKPVVEAAAPKPVKQLVVDEVEDDEDEDDDDRGPRSETTGTKRRSSTHEDAAKAIRSFLLLVDGPLYGDYLNILTDNARDELSRIVPETRIALQQYDANISENKQKIRKARRNCKRYPDALERFVNHNRAQHGSTSTNSAKTSSAKQPQPSAAPASSSKTTVPKLLPSATKMGTPPSSTTSLMSDALKSIPKGAPSSSAKITAATTSSAQSTSSRTLFDKHRASLNQKPATSAVNAPQPVAKPATTTPATSSAPNAKKRAREDSDHASAGARAPKRSKSRIDEDDDSVNLDETEACDFEEWGESEDDSYRGDDGSEAEEVEEANEEEDGEEMEEEEEDGDDVIDLDDEEQDEEEEEEDDEEDDASAHPAAAPQNGSMHAEFTDRNYATVCDASDSE